MTGRYRFELASPEDDAELRTRMAQDWMEGNIAVSFRREPSYFRGCRLQGDATDVIKCVDSLTGGIVGLGSRSTLLAYIDGKPRRIGYLSDLRSAPAYRGRTLLARGFRFLRELHMRDPVPFYYSVIYEGNQRAFDNLIGARAGLPVFRDIGRILTPAIHLDFPRSAARLPGVETVRASRAQLREIVEFLNTEQARKQLAPVYRESDFVDGRFAEIRPEDFFLAIAGGRIVGTLAAWDQARVRQTHVERYSRPLSWLRPLYNVAARFSALKPLPRPGERIPYVYLACLAAKDDDVSLFRCLLRSAYNALRRGPWHYAIAGLHERDPLAAALTEYRRIPAAGRLFAVSYPQDGNSEPARLGAGSIYLEAGSL
jgi:hypothetical protein